MGKTGVNYGAINKDNTTMNKSRHLEEDVEQSEQLLEQLGYKQELQRKLSLFSTFGLAFANIGIVCNTSATFQTVLQRGGPVIMILCWNLVSMFMICIALALSEICSLYATSGGVYYWTFEQLRSHPRGRANAPFIAFATGWTYTLANIISIGANNVIIAMSIASLIEIVWDYQLSKVQIMWIAIIISCIHGFINTINLDSLAVLNQWNVFWSCGGLVLIIILLTTKAEKHQTLEWMFTDYENRTGFDSPFYVTILGMIGAAYSMFGSEGAAYASEETKNADVANPLAMTMSIVASWLVGFIFLVTLLLSIQDIDALLDSKLDMPVAQLFWDAVGSYGAIGFLMLIIVCQFCTGAASTTTTSRMVYALARDHAAPYSDHLKSVNRHKLPGNAVWFCVSIACCFVIAPFPLSDNAFEIIISGTTISTHLAYAMVLGCRLAVKPYLTRKGRFSLGRLSTPVTWIAFIWALFAVFVFTLPTELPIVASNFNYSSVALLASIVLTLTFWYTYGAKHYVGPRAANDDI
ncbi:amino acid/polyamine transporter I [Circinella umbellata]|nr:amino acid/polyamine transporter I [Circinella umbellata]